MSPTEIEIGILTRQGLNRRLPSQQLLRREVDAWQTVRNALRRTKGALQGEKLSFSLRKNDRPWNQLFGRAQVSLDQDGAPVVKTLAGGARVTIL